MPSLRNRKEVQPALLHHRFFRLPIPNRARGAFPMAAEIVSVLVVDDDIAIRRLLSTLLERVHAEVETAADGHDALARLESRPYSVIILDLMMPAVDGFDVLDRVSESMPELLKHIIILTAASAKTLAKLHADMHVWRVMRKPFDIHDLLSSVADCAAQRGSQLEM
jgi:CheY-like chemotaxis protein